MTCRALQSACRWKITGWLTIWMFVLCVVYEMGENEPCLAQSLAPDVDAIQARIAHKVQIPDLILYAYQTNPSIRMARETWRAKVEDHRVATGLPDPQFTFTYFPEPIETRLGPQDWNATLSQMIPFPGKLYNAGKVIETETHIARLKLDKTVREVTLSIPRSRFRR